MRCSDGCKEWVVSGFKPKSAILLLIFLVILAAAILSPPDSCATQAQSFPPSVPSGDSTEVENIAALELGRTVLQELGGNQEYRYGISLTVGQYAEIRLLTIGNEATVTVSGPGQESMLPIDTSNLTGGPTYIRILAKETGLHRLQIRAAQPRATKGQYELRLTQVRIATDRDRRVEQGQRLFMEAQGLKQQDTAESLHAARSKYEETITLWQNAEYPEGEAEARTLLGDVLNSLGQNQDAAQELEKARSQFRAIGDRAGEAASGDSYANVLYSQGAIKKALDVVVGDHAIWQSLGDHRREAHNLTYMGTLYFTLGDRQKALDCFNNALPMRRDTADLHGEGETLNETGLVYDASGEKQKALEYFTQALVIRQSIGDRRGQAATLFNIGVLYTTTGDLNKAIDNFNQALPLRRQVGNKTGEALTLIRMGSVYEELGDEQRALEFYRQGLALFEMVGDRRGEAYALNSLAATYLNLGDAKRALRFSTQALPLWRAVPDQRGEASALRTIGDVYAASGKPKNALDYYNQTLALRRAMADHRGEGFAITSIGNAYEALGEDQKALDCFRQALELAKTVGDRDLEATSLRNIGKAYYSLHDSATALVHYKHALALQESLMNRPAELSTLYGTAQVERDLGEYEAATAHCEAALELIESLRTHIVSQELRASYFATQQQPYEFYIDLLMFLHQQHPSAGYDAKALQIAERARGRSLLETLAEARANIREGVDHQMAEREQSLQQAIEVKSTRLVRLLSGKHTEQQALTARSEIERLLQQYQDLEEQIRTSSPHYAALTQPQPLAVPQIQQLLDPDTVLMEYYLADKHSFVWAVTQRSVSSFELPKRSDVESAAREVYQLLTARDRVEPEETAGHRKVRLLAREAEYPNALVRLSQMVSWPLVELTKGKRLIIVCNGALQYIPFGVLPEPRYLTTVGQPAHLWPLIVSHEVINLPSASVLAALRQKTTSKRTTTKLVAVLADPVFSPDDPRVKLPDPNKTQKSGANLPQFNSVGQEPRSADPPESRLTRSAQDSGVSGNGARLPRLVFSRREAASIVAMTPPGSSLQALDFQASRATATSAALADYRILHFATHGLLDSERPDLSGLVFSMVDRTGRPQNGFLELGDIYNLNLNADLVVLSACETGLGKDVKGEGLLGLTRGYMYAGAPRVVASLWKVDDVATAELMRRFYQFMLQQGLAPAAALRAAQLEVSKQKRWANPYYWAAFTIQGEWR